MPYRDLLPLVRRPSRYLGTEVNARHKSWHDAQLRAALIFPDLYEIGMSHLGLHILYDILNDLPWALADRAYCPDLDLEELLRRRGDRLWAVESQQPLADFDILGISIPYELCYSNILTILDLAGIPLLEEERRGGRWPLILGGGSGAIHAEPVADFFDAILVGDGEEAVVDVAQAVRAWKEAGGPREDLLAALARIPGVYVPSFYRPEVAADGTFQNLLPLRPEAGPVRRRILPDMDAAVAPARPLVPYLQIVHDRLGIEVARGCTRGCRFCQAGVIYRPVRERSPEKVLALAEQGLSATGWEEVSLLSLSTGDYGCLHPVLRTLMDRFMPEHVSVSLPSLRVGTLTPEIMAQVQRVRKTGFTLAPEAGSERLRRVINKGITEEALLETAAAAYAAGWATMKLYFMIGLPTETRQDILEIAELARRVLSAGPRGGRARKLTVSVGTFVPKPHTPFQWEPQISLADSKERIELLKTSLKGRSFQVKWHDPAQSFLEGVFSRGDRRLGRVLLRAWRHGARLDAWSDHMRPDLYNRAAKEEGIDLEAYLGPRPFEAPLPWDHIVTGVPKEYLLGERGKAMAEAYTPDCRRGQCQGCGVCDFKSVRPVTFSPSATENPSSGTAPRPGEPEERFAYLLTYSKLGPARLLAHLELVHAMHRAARRGGLPLRYSEGHHPLPRISFAQPIPLGTESLEEFVAVVLTEPLRPELLLETLNRELPQGLRMESAVLAGPKAHLPAPAQARFLLFPQGDDRDELQKRLRAFEAADHWPVTRVRKGKEAEGDLKDTVRSFGPAPAEIVQQAASRLGISGHNHPVAAEDSLPLLLVLRQDREAFNLKPEEVAAAVFDLTEDQKKGLRVLKLETGD